MQARGDLRVIAVFFVAVSAVGAGEGPHSAQTWIKRHPLPSAKNPIPKLGYEGSYGCDPKTRLLIHYGGHNQGGGGEQGSEVWTYDLDGDLWQYKEPNDCPPGVCCAQINVFHPRLRKYVRFPAFSGSHGWQNFREIYLKNSSVWTYDLDANAWQAMRPAPEIFPAPLRGAAYHPGTDLIVLHGGEGASYGTIAYDLATNSWRKLNSKGGPESNQSQPGFAYDAVNDVFVAFGSQFGTDPKTYLFDLSKNEWRVLQTKDHPPADKSAPVLAADTRNGIVLCLVRTGKEEYAPLETWVLDVKAATWTKLADVKPPDPSGSRSRMLMYLEDRNLFVLENNTNVGKTREQQIWTFRYKDAPPPPQVSRPPAYMGPRLPAAPIVHLLDASQLRLEWKASKESDIAGYIVERASVAVYSNQEVARVAKRLPDSSDAAPGAIRAVGEFEKLTKSPVTATRYSDTSISLKDGQNVVPQPHVAGKELKGEAVAKGQPYRYATYAYRIRAVNQKGEVSGPSPLAYTWPAAVQNLRAKEEGKTATRLKWDASPVKEIKGYLVYRHNGRYEKDPIVRLTPEPITATEFLDEQSGPNTRRYEVVAVDALGQEGEPTYPVWSRREYQQYYKPFIGEWHQ